MAISINSDKLLLFVMAGVLGFLFVFCIMKPKRLKEGMTGGYGTMSGLYFNNNGGRCFKNPYDPDDFGGYCETTGFVIQ